MTARTRHRTLAALIALMMLAPALTLGQGRPTGLPGGFPDLVGALKATPGCLGVESARTTSGKLVIFAWFENKKAVLNWYNSATHESAKKAFFPSAPARTPMPDIPDDGEPILAIASLTMADKPPTDATTLPVSQIAIELYRPLHGGLAVGGRFAPPSLKVPGMLESEFPAPKGR